MSTLTATTPETVAPARVPGGGWRGWAGPIAVTVLAAALRLPNLGRPQALVFDETYYAKDALSLLLYGHEQEAKEKANELLLACNGDLTCASEIFKN